MSIGKTNSIGGSYQKKTITPYNFVKNVLPDANYNALSEVEIDGVLVDPHTPIESVQDNTTKYQKVIPNNVLTYGGLSKLGGLTKKYNQLAKECNTINWDRYSSTYTDYENLSPKGLKVIIKNNSSNAGYDYGVRAMLPTPTIIGHKYLIKGNIISNNTGYEIALDNFGGGSLLSSNGIIWSANNTTNYILIRLQGTASVQVNSYYEISDVMVIDLTNIYGTGNEPTTVDQFLTDYPIFRGYVPYTTGTLDYAYTKKVDIKGFNIWDEEWELGRLNTSTGENAVSTSQIRSKNYISLIPNKTYYIKMPFPSTNIMTACLYDENHNFISARAFNIANGLTLDNTYAYMRFYMNSEYGTTYNHDICINVSNNTLNGTYKPSYRNTLLEAKIVAIKQKLVSLGYSADVLGYGLNNVYNYIDLENKQVVLKMLDKDLGTLNWNYNTTYNWFTAQVPLMKINAYTSPNLVCEKYIVSPVPSSQMPDKSIRYDGNVNYVCIKDSDYTSASDFTQAMSGVPLIYELATPVEIDVSDILDNDDIIGELESGGTITFENDDKYNLPSDVSYLVEVE